VFFLLCVAPHPVLGFLTGPCPVGFGGRIQGLAESGILSRIWDISRYIRIYPLESSRHPMSEQNGRHCWKAHVVLSLLVKRLMNIRCCCGQEAAAYITVLHPNHHSEAPGRSHYISLPARDTIRRPWRGQRVLATSVGDNSTHGGRGRFSRNRYSRWTRPLHGRCKHSTSVGDSGTHGGRGRISSNRSWQCTGV